MKRTNKWTLVNCGNGYFVIRRDTYPDGINLKREIMPKKKWKHIDPLDKEAIQIFLNQENATYEQKKLQAEARYDFDNAFINQKTMEVYDKHVNLRATDKDHIRYSSVSVKKYAFDFFILKKKLPNPVDWPEYQLEFGKYLLKQNLALSTIKRIAVNTNSFLKFLHERYKDQVPLVQIVPISKSKIKTIKAQNVLDGFGERGQFIPDDHVLLLIRYGGHLKEHIELAWGYGLRRSEVLGLKIEDLFESHIKCLRQLSSLKDGEPKYSILKGKETRKVPHWYIKPELSYYLIKEMQLLHPDSLSHDFADLVEDVNKKEGLNMTYTFHDLRHTFITNAVRKYDIRDVQLAAGHSDLRTTMQYCEDDRELSEKRFIPSVT